MKPFLPNITYVNLRKKTERARKILKLFGEGGVGVDRIKFVTYSKYYLGIKRYSDSAYYKSG